MGLLTARRFTGTTGKGSGAPLSSAVYDHSVESPWGSASHTSTRSPTSVMAVASRITVVVLASPPFEHVMVIFMSSSLPAYGAVVSWSSGHVVYTRSPHPHMGGARLLRRARVSLGSAGLTAAPLDPSWRPGDHMWSPGLGGRVPRRRHARHSGFIRRYMANPQARVRVAIQIRPDCGPRHWSAVLCTTLSA